MHEHKTKTEINDSTQHKQLITLQMEYITNLVSNLQVKINKVIVNFNATAAKSLDSTMRGVSLALQAFNRYHHANMLIQQTHYLLVVVYFIFCKQKVLLV